MAMTSMSRTSRSQSLSGDLVGNCEVSGAAKSYLADCYYRKGGMPLDEAFPDESFRIKAESDDEGIKKASITITAKRPSFYRLRVTSHRGDEIIFRSPVAPVVE